MASGKKTTEFEATINQPFNKLWNLVVNDGPKAFLEMVPEVFSSMEGPWRVQGATMSMKFSNGLPDCKCIFEEVNDDEHFTRARIVDERNKSHYHMHSTKFLPGPNSSSTLLKFTLEDDNNGQAFKEAYTRAVELYNSRINSYNICN